MSLRDDVPAYFPAGRPCRGTGKPASLVGVFRSPDATNPTIEGPGGGRIRLCERCTDAVLIQAENAGLRVVVEPLGEQD